MNIDLGCGTGTLLLDIAPQVGEAHGIDYSEAMIAEAERKANETPGDNIRFWSGTIETGISTEESYDAILSFYLLHLLEDLEDALDEVRRLLKPGGLFLSLTPCLGETMMAKHLLKIGSAVGLVPETRRYRVDELIDLML